MLNLIESYSQIYSSLIVLFSSVFFYLLFHYLHKKKIHDIIITPEISQEIMSLVDAIVLSIIGVLYVLNTNIDDYHKFNIYAFFNNYFIVGYCISHVYIEYKHNLLKIEMILHHFLTIYLCVMCTTEYLFCSNIMNGLGHIPVIFLCNFLIFRQLPDYKKKYHNFYRYNRILFAITFFIFKVIGYTVALYEGFYLALLYDNTWHLFYFMFFITILQYYWGYLIYKKVFTSNVETKVPETGCG
jgi:hypothetical protein